MSNVELDKLLAAANKAAKEMVLPGATDVAEIEFPEPVTFEKSSGTPISLEGQLDDYDFARNTLHKVIENGNVALKEILKVACNSDHPRAFEVVSTMMKTLGESSKDLLKLQEQMIDMRKKMQEGTEQEGQGIQVDGAFEGTLEQLLIGEEEKEKAEALKKANEPE